MFPLIAIAAFFILGIAFFVIGKDDFGIKRVKEVSNDTSVKRKDVVNQESALKLFRYAIPSAVELAAS